MMETLLLYLFMGWFIKLDNKTHLIIRLSLAALFGILCLIGTIDIFASEDKQGVWIVIIPTVLLLLFSLRIFFDVRKLLKLLKTEKNNSNKK